MAIVRPTDSQLDKEYYICTNATDPVHDLLICIMETETIKRTEGVGDQARVVKEKRDLKVHQYKVKRNVLVKASKYFKTLLSDPKYVESQEVTVWLEDDDPRAADVWFKVLHGADVKSTFTSTSIKDVWEVLAFADKYGLNPKCDAAKAWFAGWYDVNVQTNELKKRFGYERCQMLLFPCYTFDHPEGFATATEYLAYHAVGHITERRPDGFKLDHLRLDQRIIQQINAAKGRLKTILHRSLYGPIGGLLKEASCACKANVLYAYEKALSDTGAWPLETAFQKQSANQIMRKLQGFPGPKAERPESCGGTWCSFNFEFPVTEAIKETREYFEGLCLDCMDASKPKLGDEDEDYWHHSKLGVPWDQGCRLHHQEPTWYHSFMGRREKMTAWTKRSHGGRR